MGMCISYKSGQTLQVEHCTIQKGDYGTKQCDTVLSHRCEFGGEEMECLPRAKVEGTFGDDRYTYMTIQSYLHRNMSYNIFNLRWEQREALTWTDVATQQYTSVEAVPMSSELYFQKVTALKGEVFGLLGRTGDDESE